MGVNELFKQTTEENLRRNFDKGITKSEIIAVSSGIIFPAEGKKETVASPIECPTVMWLPHNFTCKEHHEEFAQKL